MDVSINAHTYLFRLRRRFRLRFWFKKHEVPYSESNNVSVRCRKLRLLWQTQLFYLHLFLILQTHIAGMKMTLTLLTLNPAPASEAVWKVHELPTLFSWTSSALVTVKRNGIYTFLHHSTEKLVTVAPMHQCSELRVRKTNL